MNNKRRIFIKAAGLTALSVAGGKAIAQSNAAKPWLSTGGLKAQRWAMVIDLRKCRDQHGCTDCINACHHTHNVPKLENSKHEIKWVWKESFRHAFHEQEHEHILDELKHSPVLQYLYFGLDGNTAMVAFTWISSVLAVLSLILLINPKTRNNLRILPVACAMVFISLWIEKGLELVVVRFIPSPLGTVTEYLPTFPELMISMGVYALGALVITVLYKIAISIKGEELPEIAKTSSKEVVAETV